MTLTKYNKAEVLKAYANYNWDITLAVLRNFDSRIKKEPNGGLHYISQIILLTDHDIESLRGYGCDFSILPIYLVGQQGTVAIIKKISG